MQLFVTNGIRAVSMDDISRKLGISKRTLYENFSSKDELLIRCLTVFHQKKIEQMKATYSDDQSLLDVALNHIVEAMRASSKVNPVFFQDLSLCNYAAANDLHHQQQDCDRRKLFDMLEKGKADGLIRPDVDSTMMANLLICGPNSQVNALIATGRWHMDDIIMNLALPFFRGICTVRGVEIIDKRMSDFKNSIE